ncbi:MAG: hypothetical protein GY795_16185 [Desulfobacterales bacterium]|nr:hypothetical protein [Desulfobacterales bacterium]
MKQDNKIITIILTLIIGGVLQGFFMFYECDRQNTPNKVVADFAKAYFKFDKSTMSNLICEEQRVVDDVDVIDKYVYDAATEATSLGYGMFYLKNKLYDIKTNTISEDKDGNKVRIRLTCKKRPPLKSFFTREDYVTVDETVEVAKKEDGKWKVCGSLFSLHGE